VTFDVPSPVPPMMHAVAVVVAVRRCRRLGLEDRKEKVRAYAWPSGFGDQFTRIHQVIRIDRLLDRSHHVERLAVFGRRYFSLPKPTPCSPLQVPPNLSAARRAAR
jgi:hypothetical protein